MKRIFICAVICVFALAFVGDGFCAGQASEFNSIKIKRAKNDDYKGTDSLRVDDVAGTSVWRLDKSGNFSIIGSAGVTQTYIPRERVVRIYKASQLTSWEKQAATGGMSIYQMSPGITYLVDIDSLYKSGVTDGNGVSAFATVAWSGVTFLLPDATKYSGPAYDVTIGYIAGASAYAGISTFASSGYLGGSTTIQVWAYPGMAGLTAYHLAATSYDTAYRSGNTPHTLLTEYTSSGSVSTYGVGIGTSYWELNKIGEFATFGLEGGSGISAFVRSKKVIN